MVTTVTTITTIATLGLAATASIASVITLMFFLTTRELASANRSNLSLRIARFTSVGAVPLLIIFAVIVVLEIAKII